jgi:sulfite exporter TauE/SafE
MILAREGGCGLRGFDQLIAGQGVGRSLPVVLLVAVALGLRHATDPDHLAAVSTLVASERERRVRRATMLGMSWGIGHGATLAALGIPIVLFRVSSPSMVERAAEVLVGVIIAALAARLLHRRVTAARVGGAHRGTRVDTIGSPLQACGIGIVHGLAGSAAVAVLLLTAVAKPADAVAALLVFAIGTAVSMAAMSGAVGLALGSASFRRRFGRVGPGLAAVTLLFGLWYAVQAGA